MSVDEKCSVQSPIVLCDTDRQRNRVVNVIYFLEVKGVFKCSSRTLFGQSTLKAQF